MKLILDIYVYVLRLPDIQVGQLKFILLVQKVVFFF